MSADETSRQRDDASGSVSKSPGQEEVQTPQSVDAPTDTPHEARGQYVTLALRLGDTTHRAGLILDVVADVVTNPGSEAGALLRHLATELRETRPIAPGSKTMPAASPVVSAVHAALHDAHRRSGGITMLQLAEHVAAAVAPLLAGDQADAELARLLAEQWPQTVRKLKQARNVRTWGYVRFADCWREYPDPQTREPYPLPRGWEHRADRLADDGLPWFLVADTVHDVLTGTGVRSYEAVVRSCRRALRRMRDHAEREVRLHAVPDLDGST